MDRLKEHRGSPPPHSVSVIRAEASHPAPRFPVSHNCAWFRVGSGLCRRTFSTLALAFLASLLTFGFTGSIDTRVWLDIVPAPDNTLAARIDEASALNREAPANDSAPVPGGRLAFGSAKEDEGPVQASDGSDAEGAGLTERREDLDDTGPTVRRIEIGSDPGTDGVYAAGDEIQVTVTFSQAVEVEGLPELGLRVGRETKPAVYESGMGTTELIFTYRVVEGDKDTDGLSIEASSLLFGRRAIRDKSGHAAVVEHEGLAVDPEHKVDGVRPVLAADGEAMVKGDRLILTYGEALDGTSTPEAEDFQVIVEEERREVSTVTVNGSEVGLTLVSPAEPGEAVAVSYTVGAGAEAKPLRDEAGNQAASFTSRGGDEPHRR